MTNYDRQFDGLRSQILDRAAYVERNTSECSALASNILLETIYLGTLKSVLEQNNAIRGQIQQTLLGPPPQEDPYAVENYPPPLHRRVA